MVYLDSIAKNWLIALAASAALLAIGVACSLWLTKRIWLRRQRDLAQSAIECFEDEVCKLRRKCSVLELYVNEYFNTMNAAGWSDLKTVIEQIEGVQLTLEEMRRGRQYAEVRELVALLTDQLSEQEALEAKRKFFAHAGSCAWRQRSNELLNAVMKALEESANKTRDVGVSRNRLKPTLLALADIKTL